MTVRDYAKQRLKSKLAELVQSSELAIEPLTNKEIESILTKDLGIKNNDYLTRIIKIAKGNVRLAILAGTTSLKHGYVAINNVTDIFKNYYGPIIKKENLSTDAINTLFVLAFMGPVRIKNGDSGVLERLLDSLGLDIDKLFNTCIDLNEKELVDLYQDEAAKISDQSFGNYILEYVLIEKKNITISNLLNICFPDQKNKLVFALKTLISVFPSESTKQLIKEQVNLSWESAPPELQDDYLRIFYQLDEEKSLEILKKSIDKMGVQDFSLDKFDFEGAKNKHAIGTDGISILSGFKHSIYRTEAVELLLQLFSKRPDLIMEFFFAFTDNLLFDRHSHESDYADEFEVMKILWNSCDSGKNKNNTMLFIRVASEALGCEFHKSESGESFKSFTLITFYQLFSSGSKKVRSLILESLATLYVYGLKAYRKLVEETLLDISYHSTSGDNAHKFLLYDMKRISNLFGDWSKRPTFAQCRILKKFYDEAERVGVKHDELFDKFNKNQAFVTYDILTEDHRLKKSWKEEEKDKNDRIKQLATTLDHKEFSQIFKLYAKLERTHDGEEWALGNGLQQMFSSLTADKFIEVMKLYVEHGAPFALYLSGAVKSLVTYAGIDKADSLIRSHEYKNKNVLLRYLFSNSPDDQINSSYVAKILKFIDEESKHKSPAFPDIDALKKYELIDKGLIIKVSATVTSAAKNNPNLTSSFLGYKLDETDINFLINTFKQEMESLEELYISTIGSHFDYDAKLLEAILKDDPTFWGGYISAMSKSKDGVSAGGNIFKRMWYFNNYVDMVDLVYDVLLEKPYGIINNHDAQTIFANVPNEPKYVIKRRDHWALRRIEQCASDERALRKLFGVIDAARPDDKIKYLLEAINKSKDIEFFKNIPLSPMVTSWSGSQIPLLDKDITFLGNLILKLKGLDYVEHRAYLKRKIQGIEERRKQVQIKEYLEDEDIA